MQHRSQLVKAQKALVLFSFLLNPLFPLSTALGSGHTAVALQSTALKHVRHCAWMVSHRRCNQVVKALHLASMLCTEIAQNRHCT